MEKLCLDLEQLGRAGTTAGARDRINAIEQEYFRVRASLAEYGATDAIAHSDQTTAAAFLA